MARTWPRFFVSQSATEREEFVMSVPPRTLARRAAGRDGVRAKKRAAGRDGVRAKK